MSILSAVIEPSLICLASTESAARFTLVTASSPSFELVTTPSTMLIASTALGASFELVTTPSSRLALVTALSASLSFVIALSIT